MRVILKYIGVSDHNISNILTVILMVQSNIMRILRSIYCLNLLYLLSLVSPSYAAELNVATPQSLCPVVQAKNAQNESVMFLQHEFAGGVQNLALYLLRGQNSDNIKPVTFGSSTVAQCHYKSIALAAGGDWGWHLAWIVDGTSMLNYARMDGVAWVSSPTKKLSKNALVTDRLNILTLEKNVWIVWVSSDGIYAIYSDDEGRTWHEERRLTAMAEQSDDLLLVIKESKPYLSLNNKTEPLSLQLW
jgi:hypothetical protein